MSDHGDYKEPKAGDWMVVIAPEGGEVACLKVLSIGFNNEVAAMSDGSAWAVETGAPLHRKWGECHLWPFDSSFARCQIEDLLGGASEDAVAQVYGILLADKGARGNAPAAPSPDDGWSPMLCIFCLSEMPNHTDGCTVGTPEKMTAYKAANRLP